VNAAFVIFVSNDGPRQKGAAFFTTINGEVEMMEVLQWKTAEDGVAVTTDSEAVLRTEGHVGQLEATKKEVDLIFASSTRPVLGDLLEEDEVRREVADLLDGAFDQVATVDTSDTFVDVPSQDADLHGWDKCASSGRGGFDK
jgi:hypothetical protein